MGQTTCRRLLTSITCTRVSRHSHSTISYRPVSVSCSLSAFPHVHIPTRAHLSNEHNHDMCCIYYAVSLHDNPTCSIRMYSSSRSISCPSNAPSQDDFTCELSKSTSTPICTPQRNSFAKSTPSHEQMSLPPPTSSSPCAHWFVSRDCPSPVFTGAALLHVMICLRFM